MTETDDLLDFIFMGRKPGLYRDFEGWVRGSRRFRVFATAYRGKIRGKVSRIRDEGGMEDLRAELQTAALLLCDDRFTLEYEKYAAAKGRGPDFTVTFRTHTPFNVEVRRVRSVELEDEEARMGKLVAILADKVGQMPPSIANLLWLAAEREISEADVAGAAAVVRQLAERKVEVFFTRRGFASASEFLRHYQRLSAVVVQQSGVSGVWLNPLAHHKAPREIMTAIQRLQSTCVEPSR